MTRRLFVLLGCFFACCGACATPQLDVRNGHSMTYDSREMAVVVFGGADEKMVLGDLWALHGRTWKKLADSGPAPRTFASLAYDSARRRLLLFGGNRVLFGDGEDGTFLNDFWMWDGDGWRRIDGPNRPPPRAEAATAFDSDRNVLVLFGGHATRDGERIIYGDTWEWDGDTWREFTVEGPSPRNGATMVYDPRRHAAVMFGGRGASGETWEWNGERWSLLTTADPGRFNPAMAFDGARNEIVRFGGWKPPARRGGTWVLRRSEWTERAVAGPPARNHAAMAFDPIRGETVLFGGHDGENVFGDTWAWDGERWRRLIDRPARARVENGH
jgi:hypothetical protein